MAVITIAQVAVMLSIWGESFPLLSTAFLPKNLIQVTFDSDSKLKNLKRCYFIIFVTAKLLFLYISSQMIYCF